jgi:uncharacterized iron-regulated protein
LREGPRYRNFFITFLAHLMSDKRGIIVLSLLLFLFSSPSYGIAKRQVIKPGSGVIAFDRMIKEISSTRLIFVGENHNDFNHHKNQLNIIRALHKKGLLLTIGLEMFPKRDQKALDDWVSGKMKKKTFIHLFYENWGYDWTLYRDIFFYTRDRKIPLTGLNIPKEISRKVGREGFQSLTKEELSELPPGVTCELDQRYMDFIKRVFEYKGEHDKAFRNFCEAQVLWDQAMAWYLSRYLKENPQRTVVVLSGTVHAWKYGIPRQLEKFIKVKYKVILPDIPDDHRKVTTEDTDYMVVQR